MKNYLKKIFNKEHSISIHKGKSAGGSGLFNITFIKWFGTSNFYFHFFIIQKKMASNWQGPQFKLKGKPGCWNERYLFSIEYKLKDTIRDCNEERKVHEITINLFFISFYKLFFAKNYLKKYE